MKKKTILCTAFLLLGSVLNFAIAGDSFCTIESYKFGRIFQVAKYKLAINSKGASYYSLVSFGAQTKNLDEAIDDLNSDEDCKVRLPSFDVCEISYVKSMGQFTVTSGSQLKSPLLASKDEARRAMYKLRVAGICL